MVMKSSRLGRFRDTLKEFGVNDTALAEQMAASYVHISPRMSNLLPHAMEIVEYLQEKYTLHLITNGFDDIQWGKIRSCEIDQYFKEVITSEKAMSLKPHPEIFEYALKITGASKHNSQKVWG